MNTSADEQARAFIDGLLTRARPQAQDTARLRRVEILLHRLSDPHRALVIGPSRLHGATIVSPDIRAGMALIAAALAAQGRSVIRNVQQVDRGYERIDVRLKALGARIARE